MADRINNLDRLLYQVQKPGRYTGGEWNSITKDWDETLIRVALAFPDTYEIGMSNMAMPILYDILNRQPDVLAERTFAPWPDMEELMRQEGIPLFSLESHHALGDFDIIGFSLGYELGYTNVLNMLDLAGLPVTASERDGSHPLVIAGGTCTVNPEPLADFVDLFVIGEGEEVLGELIDAFRECRGQLPTGDRSAFARETLLRRLARIPGVYVPRFYDVFYEDDGRVKSVRANIREAAPSVSR